MNNKGINNPNYNCGKMIVKCSQCGEKLLRYSSQLKRNGKYVQANRNISVRDAINFDKGLGDKFDGVSDRVEVFAYNILNGNKEAGVMGLRDRITKKALDLGIKDFAEANAFRIDVPDISPNPGIVTD